MDIKTGFLLFALLLGGWLAGCFALPTLESVEDDMSIFFDHTDASARIVGGSEAAAGSHPHMVALTVGTMVKSLLCGGSLITQRTILTAAHCINHFFSWRSHISSLRATVGTNHWNSGGTSYNISCNVTHPNNVAPTIKNDIGILITSSNVALTNLVRTVPITYSFIGQGVRSRVAGWGRTSVYGAFSATLLELSAVNTIEGSDCVARMARASVEFNRGAHVEPDIEVCTLHSYGVGTCNGDSGSALTLADNGQQFGIVSWGFPCACGAPDVFVRLSAYENWLQSIIV